MPRTAAMDPLSAALTAFDRHLAELTASDPILGTAVPAAGELITSGGKRIRPALALLCAQLGPSDAATETALNVAAGIELIHTATLVHDDIVDTAALRRNLPTLHHVLGERAAVLIGDYLFARGANLLADAGDPLIDAAVSGAIMRICTGEIGQHGTRHDYTVSRDQYLARIEGKTAALFTAACVCGGRVAGLEAGDTEALSEFGRLLGIAFQIVDDVLDYTSSDGALGKPAGADLRAGIATLPLMIALDRGAVSAGAVEALANGAAQDGEADDVIRIVRESGAVDEAHDVARDFAMKAQRKLERFVESDPRSGLESLCRSVLEHPLGRQS